MKRIYIYTHSKTNYLQNFQNNNFLSKSKTKQKGQNITQTKPKKKKTQVPIYQNPNAIFKTLDITSLRFIFFLTNLDLH